MTLRLCERVRSWTEENREFDPALSLGRVACGRQAGEKHWVEIMRRGTGAQLKKHYTLYESNRSHILYSHALDPLRQFLILPSNKTVK